MNSSPSWSALELWRGNPLARLHQDLLELNEEVRDAISRAIGQAAASLASHLVLFVLGKRHTNPSPPPLPIPSSGRDPLHRQPLHDTEERMPSPWAVQRRAWEPPDGAEEAIFPDPDLLTCIPQPPDWRQAMTLSLQALAWWFWRLASRLPVFVSLGWEGAVGLPWYLTRGWPSRPRPLRRHP